MSIKSNLRDYKAVFCDGGYIAKLIEQTKSSFLIIDNIVWELYNNSLLKNIKDNYYILNVNEENKSFDTVFQLYEAVIDKSSKKNINIISIGGGITQDVSGFFASTLYRGVNWIYIPTTLLAQADSCIGAKTSLNFMSYKNLIGTFFPPSLILISTEFLKTLKKDDYLSGVGEIAKLFIIGGLDTTNTFINNLKDILDNKYEIVKQSIIDSLLIKKNYIENDEFDAGIRNILNFGHCFGHAIESSTNYTISHGSAVVIGIILAKYVSHNRGLLSKELFNYLEEKILFPLIEHCKTKINFNTDDIINGMKKDKKRTGEGIPLIILKDEFQMIRISDLSIEEISQSIDYLTNKLQINKQ